MAAARSKAPAIGSAQWILEERHQSNDLVAQELEDFGFSVRNELEWLNEHMADIFAYNGQNNLDVFKTPGKLRGKTPRTARKKNPVEPRQPLGDLFGANSQQRPSPAQQSLRNNLQKNLAKTRFQIAEDTENVAPTASPALKSPVPQPLFSKTLGNGKENRDSSCNTHIRDHMSSPHRPVKESFMHSTQDTVMSTQQDDDVFSPPQTQSTQPTQATQSFRPSLHVSDDERRDTGESFVSAKEAFGSKNASKENLRDNYDGDVMDVDNDKPDTTHSDAQDTVIRHELDSDHDYNDTAIHHEIPEFPQPPSAISEKCSVSAETQETLHHTATQRIHAPESRNIIAPLEYFGHNEKAQDVTHDDDTVVHHDVDDQMDIDDDIRSPSDGSSPVKLVRKSSLTFASLPAREPLIAKKSMGNRISRTSHVDQNKGRNSQLGRFTGGKSLGGSQFTQAAEAHEDDMELDDERPHLQREESETTKLHNKTSTQRLYERINMLKQQNEVPKRVSQNVLSSQSSQPQSFTSSQPKEPTQSSHPSKASQPAYPHLPASAPTPDQEDDEDDWISPIRAAAPAPSSTRPPLSKSYSADVRPTTANSVSAKPISVSNPDLSTVVESTTPAGSPTALRAAKEKIIGSSATSAQVKLDQLAESPVRPKLLAQDSTEDIFSPKRVEKNEKNATSIFSHLRSPSKESAKSGKSTKIAAMPGSPVKEDCRRTRSSSEREKQKEREAREKEAKQKQRTEDKFREMREKEQSKAAAHYQKTKAAAAAKTPTAMPSQPNMRQAATAATKTPVNAASQAQSRPGTVRMDTASKTQDPDSGDEMPPPPPPKSQLPTTGQSFLPTTGAKLREPKSRKLVKAPSKDTLPKEKPQPQKIMVNLNSSRYGQAPPPANRHAQSAAPAPALAPKVAPSAPAPKATRPAPKAAAATAPRPASALSSKSGPSRPALHTSKSAPRMGRPQPPQQAPAPRVVEKPKAPQTQARADLGAARPVSRMQTVQDANRVNNMNIPPVNPAKPAKRPFPAENDESLHRPAKRPSQQAKMNPITPAHAQFAKGKIPFAEPAHASQPHPPQPQVQYPNGEEIKLPEIMTDSEDEDSDNEFEQPDWVNTPNLRELLTNQQLVDPDQIFGPIPPLNMEQVFPNKERHKRFRERTSSAYWANDEVTETEKRRMREAQERLVREGAWTYNPSPRPTPRPGASH